MVRFRIGKNEFVYRDGKVIRNGKRDKPAEEVLKEFRRSYHGHPELGAVNEMINYLKVRDYEILEYTAVKYDPNLIY